MRLVALAVGAFAVTAFAACYIGGGEGVVRGSLHVPLCQLDGMYDLQPTFFGAQRFGASLSIRLQHAGGPPDYTDGLTIEIDNTDEVARRIAASSERDADGNPVATLRVGPAGSADVLVHAMFTPIRSCGRTKVSRQGHNVGLWAFDGTITFRSVDRGDYPREPLPVNNDRITDVPAFAFNLHDPRPVGTTAPLTIAPTTPIGDAQLQGSFRFQYSRGVPAVPFSPTPESPP